MLLAALGLCFLTGCASPYSDPSRLMQASTLAPAAPPADKSLVCIHRPRARQGYGLFTGVWDSTTLVADLGNGQSVAYVCDPGKHYFLNRSVELVAVVEADLLPGKTYHLRLDTAGAFIASFKLKPVTHGSPEQAMVATWDRENHWVTRGAEAAQYEQAKTPDVAIILHDFVGGEKKGRLQHLAADDCR